MNPGTSKGPFSAGKSVVEGVLEVGAYHLGKPIFELRYACQISSSRTPFRLPTLVTKATASWVVLTWWVNGVFSKAIRTPPTWRHRPAGRIPRTAPRTRPGHRCGRHPGSAPRRTGLLAPGPGQSDPTYPGRHRLDAGADRNRAVIRPQRGFRSPRLRLLHAGAGAVVVHRFDEGGGHRGGGKAILSGCQRRRLVGGQAVDPCL
jgi:hypothetical protein